MVQDPSFDMRPTEVSQQTLDGLKTIPTATVYNAVRHFGSPVNVCEGLVRLTPGTRFAARARTLRFLPIRADLLAEVGTGPEAPEYLAMGRCGRGDALVVDLMGNTRDVVGGDVTRLELAMNHADGVIIDGAIRDLDVIIEEDYGLAVYAKARSFHGNPETRAAEENVQIQCGVALVRPGDVLVGDGDGVLVVASWMATAVLEWAVEHEEVENYIKEKIRDQKVSPGKYYPPTAEMKDEWLQVKKDRSK